MAVKLSEILDPVRFTAEKAKAAFQTEAADANPWAAEDAAALASQLADLAELRALAMGMARRVAAEAAVEPDEPDDHRAGDHLPPPSRRCARDTSPMNGGGAPASARAADKVLNGLARTVRLTAMLEQRLRAERARGVVLTAQGKAGGRDPREVEEIEHTLLTPEERAQLNARLLTMVRNKNTIVGVIREVLEADGRDEETVEDVGRVLGVRLLDWDASDTYNLPTGRMVARYLRQMRVAPDWSMFKDRDWAVEEARFKAPGSPFGSPDIPPRSWRAGVPTPDPDAGNLEALARGFAGDGEPGSSP